MYAGYLALLIALTIGLRLWTNHDPVIAKKSKCDGLIRGCLFVGSPKDYGQGGSV